MQKPSSVYLSNLEKSFGMITKCQPLLAKSGSKVSKYLIKDPFLRFWFRFVYPYQALIERQQFQLIRKNAEDHYAQFSGKTLETYFQEKAYETGQYSLVGNWWDREGENEIDYIALNEFDHTGVIAEIKRNPRKISLSALKDKVAVLPHQNFGKYHFSFTGFSMEDM
jgi:AAA+ ATPase superfamily predicted ATPase